jgi:hypothetical protein
MIRIFLLAMITCAITLAMTPQTASAGEVFKKKCPFSCKDLGIPKSHCKDSKKKNKCIVEVLPGANGNGKAHLKKKCPLSCKSMGIPKSRCKD